MASELAADSWLDVGRTERPPLRTWLSTTAWQARAWWKETTDVVILNSPWLRRTTGRSFRCGWILVIVLARVYIWYANWHPPQEIANKLLILPNSVCFAGSVVCLAASLWLSINSSRESLGGMLSFALGTWWSFVLLDDYIEIGREHVLSFSLVVLCHCNIHPVVLVLLLLSSCDYVHALQASAFVLVTEVNAIAFSFFIITAFTIDFTRRVHAVTSGVLFGETAEPLQSPVAGRSARSWCWLPCLGNWLAWVCWQILKRQHEGTSYAPSIYRNRLPICTVLGPVVALAFLLLAMTQKATSWWADLGLAACCTWPPCLLLLDMSLVHKTVWTPPIFPAAIQYEQTLGGMATSQSMMAIQTLIQAGCRPEVCALSCSVFGLLSLQPHVGPVHKYTHLWFLNWLLVVSHGIDYWRRLRAIEEGLRLSWDNASSARLAGDQVQLELPTCAPTCRSPTLTRLARPSESSGPAVVLGVLRHGERADESSSFNEWGCSADAASYPHDCPLTSRGCWQIQQLAQEFAQLEIKVVISSPFLRCVQTALIVAEECQAEAVLLDEELGEVFGPAVFESEVPWPPRDWTVLLKTLEAMGCRCDRLKLGRILGRRPQWPETIQAARVRYAKRFLDYMRRCRHTRRNCILVSHGHMLPVCASILPELQDRKVASVEYGAALVATWQASKTSTSKTSKTKEETKTWLRSRSFDGVTPRGPGLAQAEGPAPEGATEPPSPPRRGRSATRWAEGAEVQDELEEKNELLLSLNYTWSVWWQGLRFMKDDSLSGGGVQQLHAKRKHLGQSWQDVLRLLGSLPSLAEFPFSAARSVASERSSGSEVSFASRAHTASSLAAFREPSQLAQLPEAEAYVYVPLPPRSRAASSGSDGSPLSSGLKLKANSLAARRKFSKENQGATGDPGGFDLEVGKQVECLSPKVSFPPA
ncbi:Serine/threonine-protein phosphatase [Durusdinium trenchii]|uniref:Serine/threonine-protein phosphatase n=1 Tax=Durusdinium trenchii TaxID=1381693 RepID=A0ABP0QHQ5_9DINO